MKKNLFILDGHYLVYRSYYAMKSAGLIDSRGQPTGAVFGLVRLLLALFENYEPDYVVCAMDSTEPTFRHEFYEDYKLDRPEMPDELKAQLPQVRKLFKTLDIPVLIEPGFECDDLIASMVDKWSDSDDLEVVIVSNDKDVFQLVGNSVKILKQKKGLSDVVLLDSQGVVDALGVEPEKVPDFLSLVGDKADNVPGISGIGPAHASRLLKQFETVENMLDNIEEIPERFRKKIADNKEQLADSKHLVLLRKDAPVKIELSRARFEGLPVEEMIGFCRELEFRELREKLEEKADLPSDWEKIEVDFQEISISDFKPGNYFSGPGPVYGYVLPDNPELKPMQVQSVRFVFLYDEKSVIVPVSIGGDLFGMTSEKKQKIKLLVEQLAAKKFYTYHNKFLQILLYRLGIKIPAVDNVFDLQLASYLVKPDADHGFEDITQRYLAVSIPEREVEWPADVRNKWLARRAVLLKQVSEKLENEVAKENQEEVLAKLENPLTAILARMEYNGVKLDTKKLQELSGELEGVLSGLQKEAYDLAGEEFNLNSPKQMREIFFDKLELPVQGKTGSGKPSTDADTLQKLAENHRLPAVILEYRKYNKIESTYLKPLVEAVNDRTGKIHTEFNQTVAGTGRLSSSRPNLQNIPVREKFGRRVREAFVPSRADYIFIGADYSQIELRLLAHISEDETLLEAFRNDRDIHTITAAELSGKSEEEVQPAERRTAKVVNFGIAYGLSAFGLARDLDISRKEAENYIERYFNRYPGVKRYIDSTVETAKKKGYVETLWGRRRYVPELSSDDFFRRQFGRRAAVNAPIQGTAADMLKKAMINLAPELSGFDCNLLLQVHDELIFEVHKDKASRLEERVREIMAAAMQLKVPVVVNIIKGSNWAEISK
ncbi:MAG: DNA polymerase I [bacterium]